MGNRGVATEEVEQAIAAIAGYLGERWMAVDLQQPGERLRQHHHPPHCPKHFKVAFEGRAMLKLGVKGKFRCANKRFSITALEQGCQRCWRDVYARMYADEASRVAEWLTEAYELGSYPERQQRASKMRRPHDEIGCAACRSGLH